MMVMNRVMKLGAIAAVVAACAGVVGAVAQASGARGDGEGANDALEAAKAKVSLVQAVTIAEQHLNGRPSRAEYEPHRQGAAYDIEVISGDKVFDVRVDAGTGVILSSALDGHDAKDDGEEEGEERDGHDGKGDRGDTGDRGDHADRDKKR